MSDRINEIKLGLETHNSRPGDIRYLLTLLEQRDAEIQELKENYAVIRNLDTRYAGLEKELARLREMTEAKLVEIMERVNADEYSSKCGYPTKLHHYARAILKAYSPPSEGPEEDINAECFNCGCRRSTHPIRQCAEFVLAPKDDKSQEEGKCD